MKTLIVYYSYGGNTRQIARMLQEELVCDAVELQMAVPYEGSYDEIVDQGQREVERGYMPELLPLEKDVSEYDAIALGMPVWWYTFAPAVKTFLAQYDLTGKKIYPFITNGGWIGHTEKDIAAACPGAKVEKAVNIKFDGERLITTADAIGQWAQGIG